MKKRNRFHPTVKVKELFKNAWNLEIFPDNVFEKAQKVRFNPIPAKIFISNSKH